MCASVQAREKLSHCKAAGRVQGLDRISGSVFNAVTIIQTKGKMTIDRPEGKQELGVRR